jgi:GNAT superfamily N-acetyltransferase
MQDPGQPSVPTDNRTADQGREPAIRLRDLDLPDLDDVNRVITAAIETWDIAPRARRLALPVYLYRADDFAHLTAIGASLDDELIGLVALEPADRRQVPEGRAAMLVHGLYVMPDQHGIGVGTRLIDAAVTASRERGLGGLLVRAERNAAGFFEKVGFSPLPVRDRQRDYPHRLWLDLAG